MRIGWRGALGILLGVALLAFTLREVSIAAVWGVLRESDPLLFALATVAGTLIFPLRARRWQTILEPVAADIPMGPLWRSVAVGMMVTNLVPARAGEFARAFALTRETRVPFTAAFASVAVDRVFDGIIVLALLFVAMWDPALASNASIAGYSISQVAKIGSIAAATGLGVLYAIVIAPERWEALVRAVARRIAPKLEDRGATLLRTFADGLAVLRHPGRFAAVLGWTLAHWLLHATAFWLGFKAVGIEVPLSAALLLQGVIAFSVALPAAPGFFGLFEVAAVAGLALYGVDATVAVSWALGFHLLTFLPITLFGLWYFARLGMRLGDLRTSESPASTPPAAPPPTPAR